MPFCKKCGLFFAKNSHEQSDAQYRYTPSHAPHGDRGSVVSEPTHSSTAFCNACREPKNLCRCHSNSDAPKAPVASPRGADYISARETSDRHYKSNISERGSAVVVAERSAATDAFCATCCEPKGLCRCQNEPAAPSARAARAVLDTSSRSSAAFCDTCREPKGLCRCQSESAAAAPLVSPRTAELSAREVSNKHYQEPARARPPAQGAVVTENLVMGGSKFCNACGEPSSMCRCRSIAEGRQIIDEKTGKWL